MLNKTAFKPIFSSAILHSIKWQFADKILKLFGSIVVGMLMGRYLGPDQYGLLNFVYAFVWMFVTVGTLGLDEIIVKELIENPNEKEKILGTALILKCIGASLSVICIFSFTYLFKENFEYKTWLILFTVSSMVIRNFGLARLYYESRIQSKRIMIIENIAFLFGAILKLLFIFTNKPVEYFALTVFVEFTISTAIFHFVFMRDGSIIAFSNYNKKWAILLLKQSWPLIIMGLSIMLYTRSDQVMLTILSNSAETGIYSAAVRISEVFYFIPTAITISFFPTIIRNFKLNNIQDYYKKVQSLFDLLIILAIVLSFIMTLMAYPLIYFGFGSKYLNSISVLDIHIWSSVFVFLGVASSKVMVVEQKNKYNMYCTILGASLNIGLNYLLIPDFGAVGSAASTVISYMISVFSCFLFKPTRHISFLLLKSLNPYGLFVRSRVFLNNWSQ